MFPTLVALALAGFTLYLGYLTVLDHLRKKRKEREGRRLQQYMATRGAPKTFELAGNDVLDAIRGG